MKDKIKAEIARLEAQGSLSDYSTGRLDELRWALGLVEAQEEESAKLQRELQVLLGRALDAIVLRHAIAPTELDRMCLLGARYLDQYLNWSTETVQKTEQEWVPFAERMPEPPTNFNQWLLVDGETIHPRILTPHDGVTGAKEWLRGDGGALGDTITLGATHWRYVTPPGVNS